MKYFNKALMFKFMKYDENHKQNKKYKILTT